MAKENPTVKFAKENGLIDEREIINVADIACTNGNDGRAWIFINGSDMHLFELIGFSRIGECVETIDLKNAEILKSRRFILAPSLNLKYNGYTYKIINFSQPKKFIEAVREGCAK